MASEETFLAGEVKKFQICSGKLRRLVYQDTDEFRVELGSVIDELNSIEYCLKIIKEQTAGEVLSHCCTLVSILDNGLVAKLCHLTVNLVSRQQLVLETRVETVTEYLIKCLQSCQPWLKSDVLCALGAILYENTHRLSKFHETLVGRTGILIGLTETDDVEVERNTVQCIENICFKVAGGVHLTEDQQLQCFQVLIAVLHRQGRLPNDEPSHCKCFVSCARGLHNLLTATKNVPTEQFGPLLAALKVNMLYGLPGCQTAIQPTLYPRSVPLPGPTRLQATPKAAEHDDSSPHTTSTRLAGKKSKKKSRGRGKDRTVPEDEGTQTGMARPAVSQSNSDGSSTVPLNSPVGTPGCGSLEMSFLQMSSKGCSSESEFSESEGGQMAKLRVYHTKVRQCSLATLHACIKATDKRTMFGYWSCFLPDSPSVSSQGHTLFTSVMKDPSPKARSGALVVLSALLEGSKQYLQYAEDSDQGPATFTPFSVSLGYTVKELHRGLLLGLTAENSPLAITQFIKCLAVLVLNVPYQRLRPGFLSRITKHVKPFLAHRDPNIRVACLTCLGSVVSVHAPLMEVWQALQATPTAASGASQDGPSGLLGSRSHNNSESGYQSNQSSVSLSTSESPQSESGTVTPTLSSGSVTPSLVEYTSGSGDLPWIIKLCIKNVVHSLPEMERGLDRSLGRTDTHQPLPVKLESLQLLAQLCKGYFTLLRGSLLLICSLVQKCLEDDDPSVQLHGAKLLEELASSILQQLQQVAPVQPVDTAQVVGMWDQVLSGPLTGVLQAQSHHAVRATGCDCLANIGPQIFDKLQLDKRMMCITLLLGLTSDPDHHVRASAVRAIGVYVQYPCLREDVSFVADVANAIITALQEKNIGVKVKAAWSLGNLSDALVLNKDAEDINFIDDFSDMLLLKLFEVATSASNDNDKVKANAVRGLGSLLRYLPLRCYNSVRFSTAVDRAMQSLVKNVGTGTMKVRWNACYATANMFRNKNLPLQDAPWTPQIHSALSAVVRDSKNFKVRINAAMAFSMAIHRSWYGDVTSFVNIWVSLVTGLLGSEAVSDFTEYKYRDNLSEQVCSTLLHLTTLISPDDLEALSAGLAPHLEELYPYMERFWQQLTQKSEATRVTSAAALQHLIDLETGSLSAEQKTGVIQLKSFIESTKSVPACPASPAFSQTYN